jgi:PAS domain S-box-containing protein
MERTKSHNSLYASGLIEASLDPLIVIGIDGKITDMNQAKINITGIERDKLIGTNFYDYFTEPQKAKKIYQEVFANGSVTNFPLTFHHQGGKLTDVLFSGSVYTNDRGKVLGAVVVARDITEHKWAKELQIANKELAFQNGEKDKRAAEQTLADNELVYQIREKEKGEMANIELEAISESLKLASQYSLSLIEASH